MMYVFILFSLFMGFCFPFSLRSANDCIVQPSAPYLPSQSPEYIPPTRWPNAAWELRALHQPVNFSSIIHRVVGEEFFCPSEEGLNAQKSCLNCFNEPAWMEKVLNDLEEEEDQLVAQAQRLKREEHVRETLGDIFSWGGGALQLASFCRLFIDCCAAKYTHFLWAEIVGIAGGYFLWREAHYCCKVPQTYLQAALIENEKRRIEEKRYFARNLFDPCSEFMKKVKEYL